MEYFRAVFVALFQSSQSVPLEIAVVDRDFGVVLKLVESAVGDDIARVDAFHLGRAGIGDSRLYVAQMGDIVLDHVDEGGRAVLLEWRTRESA